MRYLLTAGAAFTVALAFDTTFIGGNHYGNEVTKMKITGFDDSGEYNSIVGMDVESGACSSQPVQYSGPLGSLGKEVSLHVRGPCEMEQVAVYKPCSSLGKGNGSGKGHGQGHGHQNAHKMMHKRREASRSAEVEAQLKRREMVTAVINGETVSWENNYHGGSGAPPTHEPNGNNAVAGRGNAAVDTPHKAPKSAKDFKSTPGDWCRVSYYNAREGEADDITFLGHYGGSGSGGFSYSLGNSLSYLSSDGQDGSASPQILEDVVVPSNKEFVMMTGQKCEGDSCGFYRPDTVAYHGWDGEEKAFFFEFTMPSDGTTGFNADMPALWMLNAEIPRTLQYGKSECSCWTSGCGEFDIFEILDPGNFRAKSTFHGNKRGGSSDYFRRPTDGTIKLAVIMKSGDISIEVLDDGTEFGSTISEDLVEEVRAIDSSDGAYSEFALGQFM